MMRASHRPDDDLTPALETVHEQERQHYRPRNPPVFYGFQTGSPNDRAPRAWPRFMTARVAADYADSSPWTIRRHVRPCGRRGRTFIYAIESIEEWMRGTSAARRNDDADSDSRRTPHRATRGSARDRNAPELNETHVAARRDDVAA
jgi:hypothetical protein